MTDQPGDIEDRGLARVEAGVPAERPKLSETPFAEHLANLVADIIIAEGADVTEATIKQRIFADEQFGAIAQTVCSVATPEFDAAIKQSKTILTGLAADDSLRGALVPAAQVQWSTLATSKETLIAEAMNDSVVALHGIQKVGALLSPDTLGEASTAQLVDVWNAVHELREQMQSIPSQILVRMGRDVLSNLSPDALVGGIAIEADSFFERIRLQPQANIYYLKTGAIIVNLHFTYHSPNLQQYAKGVDVDQFETVLDRQTETLTRRFLTENGVPFSDLESRRQTHGKRNITRFQLKISPALPPSVSISDSAWN